MHYIQNYYRELDDLRRIAGGTNEGELRAAFQTLLKSVGDEHQLILKAEHPFEPFKPMAKKTTLRADGVLIDRLRIVHGWWEAKDEKDDLDKEIIAKLDKGYPSDNIIFEDTQRAVLLQQGQEVFRCDLMEFKSLQRLLDLFFDYELPEVQNFRTARDKFLAELPQVARALKELLQAAHGGNKEFEAQTQVFLALCRRSIGSQVSSQQVDEMLVQHILTDQVFRAVFPHSNFHQENHLAVAIGQLESSFLRGETRANLLKRLEPYFAAIRQAAASTITSEEKQSFLKQVYEDFYSAYNAKDADRLGVVYTPQEAVRFIVSGCDWLAQVHFDKRLIDSGLEVLDPCTGTGTFVVDLLDFWRGEKAALEYKFAHELHANEVSILSYYIACLNVEQFFYEVTGSWQEFGGLCFVNTLENVGFEQTHEGAMGDLFGSLTDVNHARIQAQNKRKIPVILGNPPYNAKQENYNLQNPNEFSKHIDKRIKDTYISEGSAQNQIVIYDMYVRFFRWASDRLGEQGIVGFVTNRSYLDSRSFDGFRKVIAKEFQEVWVVDLMSDVRKNPKISGTKHNIFGIQTGVAIVFLVRNPALSECKIHYLSLDDFLTAVEKRQWLKTNYLQKLAKNGEFARIKPNKNGLWLNQPTEDWEAWLPVVDKDVKAGKSEQAIFKLFSRGVTTQRDEWVYDFSKQGLEAKIHYFVDIYQNTLENSDFEDKFKIKWDRELNNYFNRKIDKEFNSSQIVTSMYRPFVNKYFYFDKHFNAMTYQWFNIVDLDACHKNLSISISGGSSSKPFQTLVVSIIPCLDLLEKTQCMPLYRYQNNEQQENITDWALTQFRQHYPTERIEKTDIFHYTYAILHDPRYRQTYALNLKQEFPRIPFYPQFTQWAEIGRQLIDLHIHFEQTNPYNLKQTDKTPSASPKCRLKADKTQNRIEIDTQTTLENIPPQAWQYQLGNRSALEWILDQYKEKTPKDPTIREKFNTYRFTDHKEEVIELLKKVCSVSVETMRLIGEIEKLDNVHQ